MAGVELHRRILENTRTDGTDQDHLDVLHLSQSRLVGDRTDFLEGVDVPDPVEGMLEVFRFAGAALATSGRPAVAGVPCNTFHAPALFARFLSAVDTDLPGITVLHMIHETVETIARDYPGVSRVGVLSTTGTRNSGVYRDALQRAGYEYLAIPEQDQPLLHEAIYHREWGLKAVSPPEERAAERVRRYARVLARQGAEVIIPGCTELPLVLSGPSCAGVPCVEPMTILARALIRECAPEKLVRGPRSL